MWCRDIINQTNNVAQVNQLVNNNTRKENDKLSKKIESGKSKEESL